MSKKKEESTLSEHADTFTYNDGINLVSRTLQNISDTHLHP